MNIPKGLKYVPDLSSIVYIHEHEVKVFADFGKVAQADSRGKYTEVAINSHQAMKEALEGMVAYAKKQKSCNPNGFGPLDQEMLDDAMQALTLANGGQP